ncbi:MAG: hypothetical protein HDQ88_10475 [Clostridia bacterium]|nr:hypothetical protein [Clostridia bacterium]
MEGKFVITVDAETKESNYAVQGTGAEHFDVISNALAAVIEGLDIIADRLLDERPNNEEFAILARGVMKIALNNYIDRRDGGE